LVFESLLELDSGGDGELAAIGELQQIAIARHQNLGVTTKSELEKHLVLRIAAAGQCVEALILDSNHFGKTDVGADEDSDFLFFKSELRIRQDSNQIVGGGGATQRHEATRDPRVTYPRESAGLE
jgi:hypothetical protein